MNDEELESMPVTEANIDEDSESEDVCAAPLDETPTESDDGEVLARSNGKKPKPPNRKLKYWRIFGGPSRAKLECLPFADPYKHPKPPRGHSKKRAKKTVKCVTRYEVNRAQVIPSTKQPEVTNKQTDLDLPSIDKNSAYLVKWDMHDIPDQMIVTKGKAVVMDTGMVSGEDERLFAGPGQFHIRVVPNDGTGNPQGSSTVYEFEVWRVSRRVKAITTCSWRGVIPMGRNVSHPLYDPKKDYSSKERTITYAQARKWLR